MKSKLVVLFTDLASRAASFGEPVLGHLCRMAAIEAETANFPWIPDTTPRTIGIFDWDVSNDINRLDPTGAELFGIVPSRASNGLPNGKYLTALHPADIDVVGRSLQKASKGGVWEARYRVIASGEARWIFARGHCFVDKSNRPERFAGAMMAMD
jgi:PAS domain-containing protein